MLFICQATTSILKGDVLYYICFTGVDDHIGWVQFGEVKSILDKADKKGVPLMTWKS